MIKLPQGFTLIELMIVVAIISILSAIAVPQYQNYIARSQAAESIVMMDAAKVMIEDYVSSFGNFPSNKASLVSLDVKITGAYGAITGTSNINADGGELVYKTSADKINKDIRNSSVWIKRKNGTGKWSCQSDLSIKYIPKGCIYAALPPNGS